MHRRCAAAAILLLLPGALRAEDPPLQVVVQGSYTTSSSLYPNPEAPSAVDRAYAVDIEGSFGYGAEVRYAIPSTLVTIGLGAEYIVASSSGRRPITPSATRTVPVDEGFEVVPIELTAYLAIPVSGESFGLYMGGGAGAYIGHRTYALAGVEAPSTGNGTGYGIHVLGGMRWRFGPRFTAFGAMKFRDLQFESSNVFTVPAVEYNGLQIPVSQQPFTSRVNTEGIVFQFGVFVSF